MGKIDVTVDHRELICGVEKRPKTKSTYIISRLCLNENKSSRSSKLQFHSNNKYIHVKNPLLNTVKYNTSFDMW